MFQLYHVTFQYFIDQSKFEFLSKKNIAYIFETIFEVIYVHVDVEKVFLCILILKYFIELGNIFFSFDFNVKQINMNFSLVFVLLLNLLLRFLTFCDNFCC